MQTCLECGRTVKIIKDEPYHYKASGLDNVYVYGLTQFECEECGRYVEIPKVKLLHRLIAREIVCSESTLQGLEIRFLRKEMRMKGREMAEALSVDESTYSRWEHGKTRPSPVYEKMIRLMFIMTMEKETGQILHEDIRELIRKVSKSEKPAKQRIEVTSPEWLMGVDEISFGGECPAPA